MSEEKPSLNIRRILVALDASPGSLAALDSAVELASRLHAEIEAVFVEDINLLRLGELPFTREVSHFSATVRRLDSERIESELRAQARRARQAMAQTAAHTHVRWTFRVARGEITPELLLAASEADVIFVGKSGWSRRRRIGSTTQAVLADAPRPAMILDRRIALGPVLVAYDDSDEARKSLDAAIRLATQTDGTLTVLILAENEDSARRLQTEASEALRDTDLRARFRWFLAGELPDLAEIIHSEMSCVFVLSDHLSMPGRRSLIDLLNDLECPVLVIR